MFSQEPEEEGYSVLCQGEWLVSSSQEEILIFLYKGVSLTGLQLVENGLEGGRQDWG